VRLLLRRAGVGVALGVSVGLVAAFAASRVIAPYLYATTATDPMTYAGSAVLLAATALIAAWLPARRSDRVNPASVLRDIA
jgi:putative ABC transport system permease protein